MTVMIAPARSVNDRDTRQQIRVGGRWQHKESSTRVAVVTQIVYPHAVEYKYGRTLRYKNPLYEYMTPEPFTRRTKVPYRKFILNFKRVSKNYQESPRS
jgi:hypothetical protein